MTRPKTATGTFTARREPRKTLSRDELGGMASEILDKLYCRATAERFRPKESDKELMSIVRGFTGLANAISGIIRDGTDEDLERRLVVLEERSRDANHQTDQGWGR